MSIPCLHSPVVSAMVPSASRIASWKNDFGCCCQNLSPRGVEDLLQAEDVARVETTAEVARRGGVGDAPGSQGIQVGLVATQQLQVLQTRPPGQQVVGDVEHVVGLVVGQMELQQAEALVDGLVEPELAYQEVDRSDAAMSRGAGAIAELVMDVGGGHDRPVAPPVVVLVQPSHDPLLASFDLMAYLGIHSKTSVRWGSGFCSHPLNPTKRRGFSRFLCAIPAEPFRGRLA